MLARSGPASLLIRDPVLFLPRPCPHRECSTTVTSPSITVYSSILITHLNLNLALNPNHLWIGDTCYFKAAL